MGRDIDPVAVGPWRLGSGQRCVVIAEAGVNHNGDLGLAHQLVEEAAACGVDAVKFQTFRAEAVLSPLADKAAYQKETTDAAESQLEMARRLELPFEAFVELAEHCRQRGLVFLSTPFDEESASFLNSLDVVAFKVSSGDLTNLPFLRKLAGFGRPLIISTGMATLGEVEQALVQCGQGRVVLLHCVSAYPAAPADMNLRAMDTLRRAFGVPVGLSDHTEGIAVPIAAVALGACAIEKHFTLDRKLPGPDHRASLEPRELAALVRGVREVWEALGDGYKRPMQGERDTARVARRSLVATRDLSAGETLTADMIAIKRPGNGLPPALLPHVLGRALARAVRAGELIKWEMLA